MMYDDAAENGTLVETEAGVKYAFNTSASGYTTLMMWSGKSMRPFYYYSVLSREDGMKAVEKAVAQHKAHAERKAKDAAERKAAREAARKNVKVGALYCASWGYEQTNVNFYEVVKVSKTGATVWLREVAATCANDSGTQVKPCPGKFLSDKELKRRVCGKSVRVHSSANAYLTTPDETHYRTGPYGGH
jgi:hypothetical protein